MDSESVTFTPSSVLHYYVRVYGRGVEGDSNPDNRARFLEGYYPDYSPGYSLAVTIGRSAPETTPQSLVCENLGSAGVTLGVTDDGPLSQTSVMITSLPQHGRLLFDGQPVSANTVLPPGNFNLTFEPEAGFVGLAVFSYRASDGELWSEDTPVTVTVRYTDADRDQMGDSAEAAIVNADPGDAITSIDQVHPWDDFDGDGRSNLDEFIAGTDGTNASSRVDTTIAPENADDMVLTMPTVSGRRYSLQRSSSPGGPWTDVEGMTDIPGDGQLLDCVVPKAGQERSFYRFVISLDPALAASP